MASSQPTEKQLPAFSELPLNPSHPRHSAWGLWGANDEKGTLNLLTDAVVKRAAAEEIRTGSRISLNWYINASAGPSACPPFFARQAFHHHVYLKSPPRVVVDDTWSFNSQVSSQWDGLRHIGYQAERLFYGGVTPEEIVGDAAGTKIGIHNMAEQGIVGRGVLLDFHRWREETGRVPDYNAFETGSITLQNLLDVANHQGTTFRRGDILLIRSGWFAALDALTTESQKALAMREGFPTLSGLEQSTEMLEWLWSNHFAAVGGDAASFECYPPQKDFYLHEVLLAGWGCPIGELFHLERLSEKCRETGRYHFFVTSEPCNVVGGVASPPNILAIF
jgi:kynurenine formamidase